MNVLSLIAGMLIFVYQAGPTDFRHVSGTVKSADESQPLEGVKVSVKGTQRTSGTQPDGIFYIDVSPTDSVLVFHLNGFIQKEVKLTSSSDYTVQLERKDNAELAVGQPQLQVNIYKRVANINR